MLPIESHTLQSSQTAMQAEPQLILSNCHTHHAIACPASRDTPAMCELPKSSPNLSANLDFRLSACLAMGFDWSCEAVNAVKLVVLQLAGAHSLPVLARREQTTANEEPHEHCSIVWLFAHCKQATATCDMSHSEFLIIWRAYPVSSPY